MYSSQDEAVDRHILRRHCSSCLATSSHPPRRVTAFNIAKMCQQAIGLGFAVGSAATNDYMKKFHVSETLMTFVTVRARHVSPCSHQPSSQYRKCLDIAEPVPRRSSPSRLTPARCATGFMLKGPRHLGDALPVAAESLVS